MEPFLLYPVFLRLDGKEVLVVGAGTVAAGKIDALLQAGAVVDVVAPDACGRVEALRATGEIRWFERGFESSDIHGKFVVIAATSDEAVNHLVAQQCRDNRVWVNVVDDPSWCDFFVPAVVRRGLLSVAIGSDGGAPGFSKALAAELDSYLHSSLGEYVAMLADARRRIRQFFPKEIDKRKRANLDLLHSPLRKMIEVGNHRGAQVWLDGWLETVGGEKKK